MKDLAKSDSALVSMKDAASSTIVNELQIFVNLTSPNARVPSVFIEAICVKEISFTQRRKFSSESECHEYFSFLS